MAAAIPLQLSITTFPDDFGTSLLRNEAGIYGIGVKLFEMDLITFALNRNRNHWILCSIVQPISVKYAHSKFNNLIVVAF